MLRFSPSPSMIEIASWMSLMPTAWRSNVDLNRPIGGRPAPSERRQHQSATAAVSGRPDVSPSTCGAHDEPSDVLRADLLDQAVLESLLATYADTEVVSAAIERWRSRAAEQQPDSASQVRRVEAEISGTQSAVERYYSAFENGRLSECRFGSRVDALERRLTQLRAKLAELRDASTAVEAPSKEAVRSAEEAVRHAMLNGTPGQRKALLKELIVEVRVESRDSIIPTFRLPATSVRVTEAMVGRGGLEPPTSAFAGPMRPTNKCGALLETSSVIRLD